MLVSVHGKLPSKYVKYIEIFLFVPFFGKTPRPTGQTRRRIFTLDFSNDADSARMLPLGDSSIFDIAPYFGVKSLPKNIFGLEYAFSSQTGKILTVSYYWNYCIDYNQILHNDRGLQTTKWSLWVDRIRAKQIQDGGRPPFKKSVKSPYLCNRLTDFDEIWQRDADWPPIANLPLKFQVDEIQIGGLTPFWKPLNYHISATVRPFLIKFGTAMLISTQNLP